MIPISKPSGMTHVNEELHSFICQPQVESVTLTATVKEHFTKHESTVSSTFTA